MRQSFPFPQCYALWLTTRFYFSVKSYRHFSSVILFVYYFTPPHHIVIIIMQCQFAIQPYGDWLIDWLMTSRVSRVTYHLRIVLITSQTNLKRWQEGSILGSAMQRKSLPGEAGLRSDAGVMSCMWRITTKGTLCWPGLFIDINAGVTENLGPTLLKLSPFLTQAD